MIHPTAIVASGAKLADGVEVGPYSVVGDDVHLGPGCILQAHCVVQGPSRIGAHNHFYPFSMVGADTPDLKYKGEPTTLLMGDHNCVREGSSIHRGTVQDSGETRIGSHNLFMPNSHVAHDCIVGDHCILSQNAAIGGHVRLDDWAIMGAFSASHQHCNIGAHAFVGGMSKVDCDVPAFVIADGNPMRARAINKVGMLRRGFAEHQVRILRRAWRILYLRKLSASQRLEQIEALGDDAVIATLVDSIRRSERGLVRG